jgi:hypothetical protein
MGHDAKYDLRCDEGEVERGSNCKCGAEIRNRVVMVVPMMVRMRNGGGIGVVGMWAMIVGHDRSNIGSGKDLK